jgi:hypothetical protein
MSKRACVDANYVVGLFDDRDALHPAAREFKSCSKSRVSSCSISTA